jgi:hypothetical protein
VGWAGLIARIGDNWCIQNSGRKIYKEDVTRKTWVYMRRKNEMNLEEIGLEVVD